ncbi:MAG TPA: hypothetical protein PLK10_12515, partial [Ottowia sp.]|nr:hypothetical protein [Ottowia sp.]
AWKSIGDSLMDEVNRIRGVLDETAGQGVDYWQSQLAIAKAQAMAGDQDAAKSLAGISQNLLRAGEASATSMLELQRLRAQVAHSLQDVAGYAYGMGGVGTTAPAPATAWPEWTKSFGLANPAGSTSPAAITNTPTTTTAPVTYVPPPVQSQAPVVLAADPGLLAELRALRQSIEDSDRIDVDLQRRSVRVLERWEAVGMPHERVEA